MIEQPTDQQTFEPQTSVMGLVEELERRIDVLAAALAEMRASVAALRARVGAEGVAVEEQPASGPPPAENAAAPAVVEAPVNGRTAWLAPDAGWTAPLGRGSAEADEDDARLAVRRAVEEARAELAAGHVPEIDDETLVVEAEDALTTPTPGDGGESAVVAIAENDEDPREAVRRAVEEARAELGREEPARTPLWATEPSNGVHEGWWPSAPSPNGGPADVAVSAVEPGATEPERVEPAAAWVLPENQAPIAEAAAPEAEAVAQTMAAPEAVEHGADVADGEAVWQAIEEAREELEALRLPDVVPSESAEAEPKGVVEDPEEDPREAVRRAVEAARAELAAQQGNGWSLPSDEEREEAPAPKMDLAALTPAQNERVARIEEMAGPKLIVIEDPYGRVELVQVYDTLSRLEKAAQAALLNYTPHSVTVGLNALATPPSPEELAAAAQAVFGRVCSARSEGSRTSVQIGSDAA